MMMINHQDRIRVDGWTLGLLALILLASALTVVRSEWAPGLDLLPTTALAGLLLGILIAHARFQRVTAHVMAACYGAAWIAFTSVAYLRGARDAVTLGDQLMAFGRHIAEWFWFLLNTGIGKDNFIFLLSLMVIFWQIGYLAAWFTFRAPHVLRAVLPAGLVILINLYYYGGSEQLSIFLYMYFVVVLLYIARMHFRAREQEWQRARVGFESDLRESFLRGGAMVTAAAVLVAWAVPTIAPLPQFDELWRQFSRPIRTIEDSFNRVFSALQSGGPALSNPYGRTLGFGGPRNLTDAVVMDVLVHPSENNAYQLARYWRAGTYDYYTSGGWQTTGTSPYTFGPDAGSLETPYAMRANVEQTFTYYLPRTTLLHAAGQPVFYSLFSEGDVNVLRTEELDRAGLGAGRSFFDPSFVLSIDALRPGDAYDAVSALSIAGVDLLRNAGVNYPPPIVRRYTQLPDDFSPRVKALAQQIVDEAAATNPFDQASAIESWLRRNVTYNEKIEAPALGQDGVEYVLFETQAGYCDYYASSMITMLRSLGVPARLAIGYAQGEFNSESGTYRVRERDSHSWVEVFFPSYGWVEFEPTAARPLISRPVTTSVDEPPAPLAPTAVPEDFDEGLFDQQRQLNDPLAASSSSLIILGIPLFNLLVVVGGLLVVGGVASYVGMYVYENRGLRQMRGAGWAYARLVRLARWLGVDLQAHQTPYEQARLLREAVPETSEEINHITDDFVRETFARDDRGAARARSIWQHIRLSLWRIGARRRVSAWVQRRRPRLRRRGR
jgi:transglutaminase-like putative cysteine protease